MSVESLARTRPLHVAVELSGAGHHPASASHTDFRIPLGLSDYWVDLTAGPLDLVAEPVTVVRVRAHDLREAQQRREAIRAGIAEEGRDPDSVTVLVDVEVLLADDHHSARRELARLDARLARPRVPDSIFYVGTASGLTGLIADIRAAGVADGVTLLPLVLPRVLDRVVDDVLPELYERGLSRPSEILGEVLGRFGLSPDRRVLAS
ncbi:LLM class flavin-dependent oxidoreductase [Rhodococcus spelaei]|uniref:LLM class flavin-dependent oxidoreductase n=1 Tax=Rhodococcus spelaei TaxID=2546320 RepID=A0A541BRP3_9NOCA|nr:LLM class flavin-dependent oxidoreductase [Rhodococcus spelaei]TQF75017.1 LLM class flavin-dependent oxidoreductase [Rhodococcus spelaei]